MARRSKTGCPAAAGRGPRVGRASCGGCCPAFPPEGEKTLDTAAPEVAEAAGALKEKQAAKGLAARRGRRAPQGFTLLELTVVVTVLLILAGGAMMAFGDAEETARKQIAQHEMQQLKQALLRFRQDTGSFPSLSSPADFSALYDQPAGMAGWNIDTSRGWRGPYLGGLRDGLVDIGDSLQADGTGDPAAGNEIPLQRGVADPFVHANVPDADGCSVTEPPNDGCLLEWRPASGEADYGRWGRPYLLFDLDQNDARVVSSGLNGRYESANAPDPCVPGGDDLVVCLLQ
jgi:prepilin-type N-terminal cleavage/methylation domain-containing protein